MFSVHAHQRGTAPHVITGSVASPANTVFGDSDVVVSDLFLVDNLVDQEDALGEFLDLVLEG